MDFATLIKMKEDYQKAVREEGQTILKEYFVDFFARYPEVKAVGWQQWIPGFNDGEPCLFTIGEPKLNVPEWNKIARDDPEAEDDGVDGWCDAWSLTYNSNPKYGNASIPVKVAKRFNQANTEVEKTINTLEDALQTMFGENAEVRVYPDRIESEEYDCGY